MHPLKTAELKSSYWCANVQIANAM